VIEDLARAAGVRNVSGIDPIAAPPGLKRLIVESLAAPELAVIVSRRNCLLAAGKIKTYERAATAGGVLEKCVEQES
jgi:indolepyruvate ferredoxin oxidoreductase alpha subunit